MRGRRIGQRILAIALGLLLGVVSFEIVLRAIPAGEPAFRSTRLDTPRRVRPRLPDPRSLPEVEATAPVFRVVVVGDSFTWGAGIYQEDAYPRRIEMILRRLGTTERFEVVTLARPGWDALDGIEQLRPRLDDLDPDLLVVGYVLNDPEPRGRASEELREPLTRRTPKEGVGGWLHAHSTLFRFVWGRFENTRQRRAFDDFYARLHAPAGGFQRVERAFDGFAALASVRGLPVVVAVFPVFDFESVAQYRYGEAHRLVLEAARRRGLRAIDLLRAYEGIEGRRLSLVPFVDAHPSELGHRIAAEAIARYLLVEGLVAGEVPEPRRREAARRIGVTDRLQIPTPARPARLEETNDAGGTP